MADPVFTNDHGQQPSPPLPADHPVSVPPAPKPGQRRIHAKSRLLQRMGREPIDLKQCQAPIAMPGKFTHHHRCTNPAAFVFVENKERDGAVAAMSLCKFHHDMLLVSHGADAGKMTPLTP